ncbi:MAG: hypothetical protein R3254_08885 [Thiomicrorhabdus sp.]|nr:hypothetical protein [Thiomicrorhabdus sp.]
MSEPRIKSVTIDMDTGKVGYTVVDLPSNTKRFTVEYNGEIEKQLLNWASRLKLRIESM